MGTTRALIGAKGREPEAVFSEVRRTKAPDDEQPLGIS